MYARILLLKASEIWIYLDVIILAWKCIFQPKKWKKIIKSIKPTPVRRNAQTYNFYKSPWRMSQYRKTFFFPFHMTEMLVLAWKQDRLRNLPLPPVLFPFPCLFYEFIKRRAYKQLKRLIIYWVGTAGTYQPYSTSTSWFLWTIKLFLLG